MLYCDGDLCFFGDPFPECTAPVRELRRKPKRSRRISHETLMFRNIAARLRNCSQVQFWQLWWKEWVKRPRLFCCQQNNKHTSQGQRSRSKLKTDEDEKQPPCCLVLLWLPVSLLLMVVHVLPLCSVWGNYLSSQWWKTCSCSRKTCLTRCIRLPLFLSLILGITFLYIMVSGFQTQRIFENSVFYLFWGVAKKPTNGPLEKNI